MGLSESMLQSSKIYFFQRRLNLYETLDIDHRHQEQIFSMSYSWSGHEKRIDRDASFMFLFSRKSSTSEIEDETMSILYSDQS